MCNFTKLGAGLGRLGVVACLLAAAAPVKAAAPAGCDAALLENISGKYTGQQLGYRRELRIASAGDDSCRVEARWETHNEDAPMATGVTAVVLGDGVLMGNWRAGADNGRVRFDVLRGGDLLNGRMMGIKGLPDGPWDYVKAPASAEGSKCADPADGLCDVVYSALELAEMTRAIAARCRSS